MNNQPLQRPPEMPDEAMEKWEIAVQDRARQFAYPPTPDIAASVRARRKPPARGGFQRGLRLALTVLLAFIIATLAVPQTRAFVLDILRIGAVRVFFGEPAATVTVTPGAGRRSATSTPIASVLDLPGETTLADAEQQLGLPILVPSYPPELGAPDRVFAQKIGSGIVVTLVWVKIDDPTQADLILQMLNPQAVAAKYFPWETSNQRSTQVHGRSAFWLTGVHSLFIYGDDTPIERLIDKNLLLWDEGRVTYRLETDLDMDEAVRIAESLQ